MPLRCCTPRPSITINSASYDCDAEEVNFNYTIAHYPGGGSVSAEIIDHGGGPVSEAANGTYNSSFGAVLINGSYELKLTIDTPGVDSEPFAFDVCCLETEVGLTSEFTNIDCTGLILHVEVTGSIGNELWKAQIFIDGGWTTIATFEYGAGNGSFNLGTPVDIMPPNGVYPFRLVSCDKVISNVVDITVHCLT